MPSLLDAALDVLLFGAVLVVGYQAIHVLLGWRRKVAARRSLRRGSTTSLRRRSGSSLSSGSTEVASDECDTPAPTPSTEMRRVAELRRRVQLVGNADKLPGGARWYDDIELLRFSRARKSLDESVQLFEKSIAWRLEHQGVLGVHTVDGSLGKAYHDFESGACEAPAWWRFLHEQGVQQLVGADDQGLPITYLGLGHADLAGCEREVGLQALTLYFVMLHDRFLDLARKQVMASGANAVEASLGGFFLIDLLGLQLRHSKDLGVLKKLGQVSNALMPERTRKHFIINAPSLFASVWPMVTDWIHPRTQAKISILKAGKSLDPIFEELGRENVPAFLGGAAARLDARPPFKRVKTGDFDAWQQESSPTAGATAAAVPPRPWSPKLPISPASRRRLSRMAGLTPCCFGGG